MQALHRTMATDVSFLPSFLMLSGSHIELSASALKKNIQYLQRRIGIATRLVSVIKGNAYGHGIEAFLPLAEQCGMRSFAVSDATEAERAYRVKRAPSDLMIMSMIDNDDLPWAIERGISFYVFDEDRLQAAITAAARVGRTARIHIEVETGFNRTGFKEAQVDHVIDRCLQHRDALRVDGVCTHFAGAESIANYYRNMEQSAIFGRIRDQVLRRGLQVGAFHAASSAAALTYPHTTLDMVRSGIAMYGFWPSKETRIHNMLSRETHFTRDPLHQVLTWKSRIMSLNHIAAGQHVGYGTSYLTAGPTKAAVIPVGYYHGYSRNLGNLGEVLIRNRKAPVMGMVNMNMILVNVTAIPGA
ncbi:MAG: alanine racemase, partial [Bacteroidetes bacterium]|nr:alanine racemase [Bacteroidota bacterium]